MCLMDFGGGFERFLSLFVDFGGFLVNFGGCL